MRSFGSIKIYFQFYLTMKIYFAAALLFYAELLNAQNLVLNPSFENYCLCKFTGQDISHSPNIPDGVLDWFSPTLGSPDYFTADSTAVPYTVFGFQVPHTGKAYCGLMVFNAGYPEYREYLETELIQPLIAGHNYCVKFYVSLANGSGYASGSIEAGFAPSFDMNQSTSVSELKGFDVQVANAQNNLITDTANWTMVSGIYHATGGEKVLTIGNFYSDVNTTREVIDPAQQFSGYPYYFIDDVSVTDLNITINALGHDTTLCDGQTILLSAANDSAISYLWQNGSIGPNFLVDIAGTYKVLIDFKGCGLYEDSVRIGYLGTPKVHLGNDTSLCNGNSIVLTASKDSLTQFRWQNGSIDTFLIVSTPGTYILTASNRCTSASDSETVSFINCDCAIEVPTAFTPNGDGINDLFFPQINCKFLASYHMQIFSRYGELLFTSNQIDEGWNGTVNSVKCTIGTYAYAITYTTNANNEVRQEHKTGYVVLIR